jgi:hypothetical protein
VPSLMHRRWLLSDRITYVELVVHKEGVVLAVAEGGGCGAVREYSTSGSNPVVLPIE